MIVKLTYTRIVFRDLLRVSQHVLVIWIPRCKDMLFTMSFRSAQQVSHLSAPAHLLVTWYLNGWPFISLPQHSSVSTESHLLSYPSDILNFTLLLVHAYSVVTRSLIFPAGISHHRLQASYYLLAQTLCTVILQLAHLSTHLPRTTFLVLHSR